MNTHYPLSAAGLSIFLASAAAGQSAQFIPIPAPAGGNIAVLGMSPDGTVLVGQTGPGGGQQNAFRWTQSGGSQILWPGFALDASNNGVIVGGTGIWGPNTIGNSVRWTAAAGPLVIPGREATGVSADGSVAVGGTGAGINNGGRAFRWTVSGGMQLLPLLSGGTASYAHDVSLDGSVVVGYGSSSNAPAQEGFRWSAAGGIAGMGGLPGGSFVDSIAMAVSPNGQWAAGLANGVIAGEPFVHNPATGMTGLGTTGYAFAIPEGMTHDGSTMVGSFFINTFHAMIYDKVGGVRFLAVDLYDRFNLILPGWTLNVATGISADGTRICGYGTDPNGTRQGFLVILDFGSVCYANCDNSTAEPRLNVADFTCFLQRFAEGSSYANCDQSTVPPVLNVADFTCFLQRFAAGCP
jgi:uncharacterized membrane protein